MEQNKTQINATTKSDFDKSEFDKSVFDKSEFDDFLDQLNQEFQAAELKKYIRLIDLPKNINYKIINICRIQTRYGEKYAIELNAIILGNEHTYTIILPDRYNKMTDVQTSILKNSPEIKFRYEGKTAGGNHIIKFVKG